jgi:hypothetical protein
LDLRGMMLREAGETARNEQLYNLYSSPDIRVIKSRRSRLAEHVARMGK